MPCIREKANVFVFKQFAQVTFTKKEPKVSPFVEPEEPHVKDPFRGKKFDVIAKQASISVNLGMILNSNFFHNIV